MGSGIIIIGKDAIRDGMSALAAKFGTATATATAMALMDAMGFFRSRHQFKKSKIIWVSTQNRAGLTVEPVYIVIAVKEKFSSTWQVVCVEANVQVPPNEESCNHVSCKTVQANPQMSHVVG